MNSIVMTIKRKFSKACSLVGIHVGRIPNAVTFCRSISNYSPQIRRYEIKNFSDFLVRNRDHRRYEDLLNEMIPTRKLNIVEAQFIKGGETEAGLRGHRKVKIDGIWYFEKVFFNSFEGLKRNLWFQKNAYQYMKGEMTVPTIKKYFIGEWVSVGYFEYKELKPIERREERLHVLKSAIRTITEADLLMRKQGLLDDGIRDFRQSSVYKGNTAEAHTAFREHGFVLDEIVEDVLTTEVEFCHGDLHPQNIYKNEVVIDWDANGFYPIGFEYAVLYCNMLHFEEVKNLDAIDWLETEFSDTFTGSDPEMMLRNFLFFVLVFTSSYDKNAKWWSSLRRNLWNTVADRGHLLHLKSGVHR